MDPFPSKSTAFIIRASHISDDLLSGLFTYLGSVYGRLAIVSKIFFISYEDALCLIGGIFYFWVPFFCGILKGTFLGYVEND
jgi:hypothetical protein